MSSTTRPSGWRGSRSTSPSSAASGIVYCLTVDDTERVAAFLRQRGIDARAYSARLGEDEREALELGLLADDFKVLVATVALGMGFDKPNLGFVIHYQRPGSAITYYQQVGRAGRGVDDAYGILLSGREDDEIARYFIHSAFPPVADIQAVIGELGPGRPWTLGELTAATKLHRKRVETIVRSLHVDGVVARDKDRYSLTGEPWQQGVDRIARVIAMREAELAQMQAYVEHDGCLMAFLARALDDPNAAPCGRCAPETGGFSGPPSTPRSGSWRRRSWVRARRRRPRRPRSPARHEPRLRRSHGGPRGPRPPERGSTVITGTTPVPTGTTPGDLPLTSHAAVVRCRWLVGRMRRCLMAHSRRTIVSMLVTLIAMLIASAPAAVAATGTWDPGQHRAGHGGPTVCSGP